MSTFEVKIRQIDKIEPHPNADKLECVVIGGYKAVVQKDIHKVGDLILYIPEDTVFMDISIAERLKVAAYLTGKYKNRVKAVRLRGLLSQGIVLPYAPLHELVAISEETRTKLSEIYPDAIESLTQHHFWLGMNLAEVLKLQKYEEPIPIEMAGHVRRWPSFLAKYDVENIKRPESLAALRDQEWVVATEKLHGTNFTVAIGPGLEEGEEAFVCSRNNALKESDTNVYWKAVRKYNLIKKVKLIYDDLLASIEMGGNPFGWSDIESVSLHGEIVGVQDLKYGFINGEIGFFAFDIKVNGEFIDYRDFVQFCEQHNIPMVPVVYEGPYNYELMTKRANLPGSCLGEEIMEGLVVKPVVERQDSLAGRVQFKFISEAYLLRKGGTELH